MTNVVLGTAFIEVRPEFRAFENKLAQGASQAADQAQRRMRPIQPQIDTQSIQKSLLNVGNIARAVIGAAVVVAFKRAVDASEAYAGSIRQIAAVTGESAEETSKLVFVLNRVGINERLASRSLVQFNRNIAAGSRGVRRYFDDVEIANLRTKSLSQQLPILAQKFQDLERGAPRTNFLRDLFGFIGVREFGKLLSLTTEELKELGDEADRFGLILTEQNLVAFKKYTESTRALTQAQKGLQVQIGQASIPILQKLNEIATDAITGLIGINDSAKNAVGGFAVLATGISTVVGPLDLFINVIANTLASFDSLRARRAGSAAAATAETTATAREAAAHVAATRAVQGHTAAEIQLAAAVNAAAGAQTAGAAAAAAAAAAQSAASASAGAGAATGGLLRGAAALARGLAGPAAVLAATILGIGKLDELRDKAIATEEDIRAGNELRLRAIQLGGGGAKEFDIATEALKELKEEGKLSAEAIEELGSANTAAKIRRTVEAGGDLPDLLREIVEEANDGADSIEELGGTVSDFITTLDQLRDAQIQQKGAQAQLTLDLRKTGVATEAGENVLANYAQQLFEIARAAAEESGAQFDAAKARQDAAEAALEAGQDFIENEKKIAEAAAEGRENIIKAEKELAETIRDQRENVLDAQEDLAEAIKDRNKDIADAEEDLADTIIDQRERVKEAEQRVDDAREDGIEAVSEARKRLKEQEISAARSIADAERRLRDARRQRVQAITDGTIAIEAAQRAGDAEAENAARIALARTRQDQSIKDAERDLRQTRRDAIKDEQNAREDLADTIRDTNRRNKQAEQDLAKARVEAAEAVQEAQERLADTVEDANDRVRDAAEGLADAQRDAAEAITDAQQAVADANREAAKAIDDLTGNLEPAIVAMQVLNAEARQLERVTKRLGERLPGTFGRSTDSGTSPGGFQHGGPVIAGRPIRVGEAGEEIFIPPQNGQIISNSVLLKLAKALENGAIGRDTPSFTVVESQNPEVTLAMIQNRLLKGVNL